MSDRHESKPSATPPTSTTSAPITDAQNLIKTDHAGCCSQLENEADYTQLGDSFRLMTPEARRSFFGNIAHRMARVSHETRLRVICQLFSADPHCGIGVAQALGIALNSATSFSAGRVKA